MNELDNQLPSSWYQSTLEDIAEIHDNLREPVNASKRSKRHGSYPYYGATGQVGWINDFRQDGEFILLGEDGAPFFDWIKEKAYLVSGKCWVNNHAHVLKGKSNLCLNRYLLHALNQTDYRGYANGTTRLKLTQSAMKQIPINLAPLAEQYRIVAKIEGLFSELDKGIENLKTAQAQLKIYRQALLKHAFEGKLTAQWREQNKDKLETAAALQKRIQTERANRYQQQLSDWQAAGQKSSKPKVPKPLPPLNNEELAELPVLPEGWAYTYLAHLGNLGRGKSKHRPRNDPKLFGGKYPFIQTGEVKAAVKVIKEFTQTYSDFGLQQSKLWPKKTLCITIAANIAETAFLGFEGCFPDSVVGFSAFKQTVAAEYIDYFIQAVRSRIEAYAPATAQKNINLETLENLVVPYCGLEEQSYLLDYIDERFSEIDQLDQTITTALQQSEALRQSILKKAFSGTLVAQDSNDEPASVLLARIKAEKVAQTVATKPRKTKKAQDIPEPAKTNVIPFPVKIGNISANELHAGLMALAYKHHEQKRKAWYFGHVKAEKIAHMIEAHLGVDLERNPIKDAAGPNDFQRLLAIEAKARANNWFDVQKLSNGRHMLYKMQGFDDLIRRTSNALGKQVETVNALIGLFVPLDKTRSEIVATLYAAWNNLLILGHKPSDEEIVIEATENWHTDKLKIRRDRFFKCLVWMRENGLVPVGRGRYVKNKE